MSKISTQRRRDINYSNLNKKDNNNNKYRDIIYDILNERNNDWEIIDKNGDLIMIHYNNNSDLNYTGHLRGVIVDIEKK